VQFELKLARKTKEISRKWLNTAKPRPLLPPILLSSAKLWQVTNISPLRAGHAKMMRRIPHQQPQLLLRLAVPPELRRLPLSRV
jgi:hypothetical protein